MNMDESDFKLKMLWHGGYWDYPKNGLAEYIATGEKVYFIQSRGDHTLNDDEITSEMTEIIDQHKRDVVTCTTTDYAYKYPTVTYTLIIYKDKYHRITYDEYGEYFVDENTFYNIYRMPKVILDEYEERHKIFTDTVGCHTWHDPNMYKPFQPSSMLEEYYIKIGDRGPIKDFNVANFEYIGEFEPKEFQWFHRPR